MLLQLERPQNTKPRGEDWGKESLHSGVLKQAQYISS